MNKKYKGKSKTEAIKEITERLEEGISKLFESDTYKQYLTTMSKFHNYSFGNTVLIAMQRPSASLVAGYQAWQRNFNRHVKAGEKGIKIMAPAPYKKKVEQPVIDKDTHQPVKDKYGNLKVEEVEIVVQGFKPVTVWDVGQTDGEPLPELGVSELTAGVDNYNKFIDAITAISPVPVIYKDLEDGSKGYFSPSEQEIVVKMGMSESQTIKTLLHEICHSLIDDKGHERIDGISTDNRSRNDKEVTADSVAYTVSSFFNLADTSEYTFGYVAGWSSGKDMKELKECMDTIRKTSSYMITGIEDKLKELSKEKTITKESLKGRLSAKQEAVAEKKCMNIGMNRSKDNTMIL